MMTEEEAKTKWCPFVQVALRGPSHNVAADVRITNRDYEMYTKCMGSHCMAWRWFETMISQGHVIPVPQGNNQLGYCGIAGKPFGA